MHEYVPFAITLVAILAGILLNRNDVKELRAEERAEIGTVRGEIGTLRGDVRGEIGSVRGEIGTLRSDINSFRAEMNARLTKIQDDLKGFHRSLGQHDKAIEILEKKR